MARKSKGPWYWEERETHAVYHRGQRHVLGPDKNEAYRKWHELAAKPEEAKASVDSVWAVLESFLADAAVNTAPRTYEFYRYRLQQFKDAQPNMPINRLRPHHVRDWLNTKSEWSSTYKAGVISSLKRAFNWAVNDERIDRNPLRALKKPAANQRERVISTEEFAAVLAKVKGQSFRDILTFIFLTGCRPQEARAIEAAWLKLNDRIVVFPVLKSKGKKRPRVIHLTDEAFEVLRQWADQYPEGPVFRNSLGLPWSANAFATRFKRLEAKVGFRLRMYDLRHSYAHDGLTKGAIAPEIMAALLGHTDTRMIYSTYGHLLKAPAFMREAATRTRSSVPLA